MVLSGQNGELLPGPDKTTGLMNRALVLVLAGTMNLDRACPEAHFFPIQVVQDLVVTFATRAVQASPGERRSCSSSDISYSAGVTSPSESTAFDLEQSDRWRRICVISHGIS
jgi:hypothetical protein